MYLDVAIMMMLWRAVEPLSRLDDFVIVDLVDELDVGYSLDCYFFFSV